LTLTAKESGEDNRISLNSTHTGMPDTPVDVLTMTEMQGAEESLNASFSVDGVEYQRQSNDGLESVIQGVTLNLDKVGETQLTISADSDNMKEKITQFIDTYNELFQEISSKIRYDSDEEKNGILSNVSSVKRLNSELAALLTTTVDTNNDISSLMDLGAELNQDGTITLDSNALDAAFSTSHNDVTKLFIGDSDNGLKGLGDILNDYLTEMTGPTGLVNGEKSAAEGKISRLESSIAVNVERLDKRYELLALQFVQLDAFIGSMNTQSQYLTSVFDAFNNSQQS
ncbi:MAG: flagellar filament capping protein FliD, partial [Desulfobacterales bacterium]|nr:flagellar filament capping protein FliD [Desulfobacterales bacterium]